MNDADVVLRHLHNQSYWLTFCECSHILSTLHLILFSTVSRCFRGGCFVHSHHEDAATQHDDVGCETACGKGGRSQSAQWGRSHSGKNSSWCALGTLFNVLNRPINAPSSLFPWSYTLPVLVGTERWCLCCWRKGLIRVLLTTTSGPPFTWHLNMDR